MEKTGSVGVHKILAATGKKHLKTEDLGKDLLEVGETMRPVNQNAYVTPIVFTGNMTIDNARVHGVMHA